MACFCFLAVRFAIVLTAVDRVGDVTWAEYQVSELSRHFWTGQPANADVDRPHLWGLSATAVALTPFLFWFHLSDTEALKLLAILVSFLGFAAMVYVLARRVGALAAAVFALLMIFPDQAFLRWSLTTWASYPEAAALVSVAVAAWAIAIERSSRLVWFAAGLAAGVAPAYSASVIYVVLALALLTPFVVAGDRRVALTGFFFLGCLTGFLPRLIWLLAGGLWLTEQIDSPAARIVQHQFFSWPGVDRLSASFRRLRLLPLYRNLWTYLGLAWVLYAGLRRDRPQRRWRLVFPLSIFLFFVACLFFSFVGDLTTRHLMWLNIAAVAAIALLANDSLLPLRANGKIAWYNVAEYAVKCFIVFLLVIKNVIAIVPYIQPAQADMLAKFRGIDYCRWGLSTVIGPEVDRVNCLIDQQPDPGPFFQAGMGELFRTSRSEKFIPRPLPLPPRPFNLPAAEADRITFARGVGCALAMKGFAENDVERIGYVRSLDRNEAVTAGFRECAALPCL